MRSFTPLIKQLKSPQPSSSSRKETSKSIETLSHGVKPRRYNSKRKKKDTFKTPNTRLKHPPKEESHKVSTPLCDSFPILQSSRTIHLRFKNEIGGKREETIIENRDGSKVAKLVYEHGRRILIDSGNQVCAIIDYKKSLEGKYIFQIHGQKQMTADKKMSYGEDKCAWAEVVNTGALGLRFRMKVRDICFQTKSNGSSFSSCCFSSSPRGLSIYRKAVDGKKYDECGEITFYGDFKSVVISRNMDFGLMLCFTAIIDEFIERRLR
jgi:hypothetical protein